MAIDRKLVAWSDNVEPSQTISTLDLTNTNAGCQEIFYLLQAWHVGMAFSSDTVGGATDTLYVYADAAGLGKVVNNTLAFIGPLTNDSNLQGQPAQLTGTGDSRLFGFFATSPYVRVAELDTTTGNSKSDQVLQGFAPPTNYSVSFWGGDFYLFASPSGQATDSSVVHYSPSTNTVDTAYVADVGAQVGTIVASGVSPCAPLTPPK